MRPSLTPCTNHAPHLLLLEGGPLHQPMSCRGNKGNQQTVALGGFETACSVFSGHENTTEGEGKYGKIEITVLFKGKSTSMLIE